MLYEQAQQPLRQQAANNQQIINQTETQTPQEQLRTVGGAALARLNRQERIAAQRTAELEQQTARVRDEQAAEAYLGKVDQNVNNFRERNPNSSNARLGNTQLADQLGKLKPQITTRETTDGGRGGLDNNGVAQGTVPEQGNQPGTGDALLSDVPNNDQALADGRGERGDQGNLGEDGVAGYTPKRTPQSLKQAQVFLDRAERNIKNTEAKKEKFLVDNQEVIDGKKKVSPAKKTQVETRARELDQKLTEAKQEAAYLRQDIQRRQDSVQQTQDTATPKTEQNTPKTQDTKQTQDTPDTQDTVQTDDDGVVRELPSYKRRAAASVDYPQQLKSVSIEVESSDGKKARVPALTLLKDIDSRLAKLQRLVDCVG
jgi:hypothetical protein